MNQAPEDDRGIQVAPFTGAWIEIKYITSGSICQRWSHPSRVRGLKFPLSYPYRSRSGVAPFTGAWIEIIVLNGKGRERKSRTLHGCVD